MPTSLTTRALHYAPWVKVRYDNAVEGSNAIQIHGNVALAMGNVFLTGEDGKEIFVDKVFAFRKCPDGKLRLIVHKSALPNIGDKIILSYALCQMSREPEDQCALGSAALLEVRSRTHAAGDRSWLRGWSLPDREAIIDLGCGPGNSTAVLKPAGLRPRLRASIAMMRCCGPRGATIGNSYWLQPGCGHMEVGDAYDIVFSNAMLQWLPDHKQAVEKWFAAVAPGGALAVQVPAHLHSAVHHHILEVAHDPAWQERTRDAAHAINSAESGYFYDILSGLSQRIDLWVTEYCHVLDGPEEIINWMRGTGLRPYLERVVARRTRALRGSTFATGYNLLSAAARWQSLVSLPAVVLCGVQRGGPIIDMSAPTQIIDCDESHREAILAILNESIANSTALYDYAPRSVESMVIGLRPSVAAVFL